MRPRTPAAKAVIAGTVAARWPVAGSHEFAVERWRVLLAGSDDGEASLFLGRFDTVKFEGLTPVNQEGEPLPKFRAFDHRDRLLSATDETLYVMELIRL